MDTIVRRCERYVVCGMKARLFGAATMCSHVALIPTQTHPIANVALQISSTAIISLQTLDANGQESPIILGLFRHNASEQTGKCDERSTSRKNIGLCVFVPSGG